MRINKWLILAFIGVSLAGFLDAAYLTAAHYSNEIPPCSITQGCEEVTTSKYAEIFNVPVALTGVVYYLTVFLLSVYYFDSRKDFALKYLLAIPVLGFVASAWFVYVQVHILDAICLYCMFSAFTSASLLVLGVAVIVSNRFFGLGTQEK